MCGCGLGLTGPLVGFANTAIKLRSP